MMEVCR